MLCCAHARVAWVGLSMGMGPVAQVELKNGRAHSRACAGLPIQGAGLRTLSWIDRGCRHGRASVRTDRSRARLWPHQINLRIIFLHDDGGQRLRSDDGGASRRSRAVPDDDDQNEEIGSLTFELLIDGSIESIRI